MTKTSPPVVNVELLDEETIVARGTRKVTWLVRVGDSWLHPARVEGATQSDREAGPGTVWARATLLGLPAGTRLLRVESIPSPDALEDPFAYLQREVRDARRKTRRTEYVVTARRGLKRIQRTPR